jgi:hypothetical protein
MNEYLIGIEYHEPENWKLWQQGEIEDYESSIGLFVLANSSDEAISWAEKVGEKLLRFVNSDLLLNYSELGYSCWHEPSLEESGWSHCVSYFQHVTVGEMPTLERMTTKAYEEWQLKNT